MQWVCYIEIQGLFASAARQAVSVAEERPLVVMRQGRVFDGCRRAFTCGLVLGSVQAQAQRDVPQAILVDWEQVDVQSLARSWWDRCLQNTPYIEPGEPHQVFLSLPAPGSSLTAAQRAEVNRLVEAASSYGFTAFAGVGASKFVARAAALASKEGWLLRRPGQPGWAVVPERIAYVQPGDEGRYLAPLPITYLPTAPDVMRRLLRLGIRTIGEAAAIGEAEWRRQLGTFGHHVAQWSRGVDTEPVKPCYPPRSVEHRVEFSMELRDPDEMEQVVRRSVARLTKQLAANNEGAQQVSIALERSDHAHPICANRVLQRLQQAPFALQQALSGLLEQALLQAKGDGKGETIDPAAGWYGGVPVTAITVAFGLIGAMPWQQLNLWDDGGRSEREDRLESALQLLQERFPARLVGLGPRRGASWREQMYQFVDPQRWPLSRRSVGAGV